MSGDYAHSDIVDGLKSVGIESGDAVFIQSNIAFFGKMTDTTPGEEYCQTFYDAVRTIIGDKGTLVVPTFTYSFTDGDWFDPSDTESEMGVFAEFVRTHPDSVRSADPNFSVAAIGPLAETFTTDPPAHSFGHDSFWERFLAHGGVICNFNMGVASTYLHYVERCLDVPYRWDKPFVGTVATGGTEQRRVFYHYVRDLNEPAHEPNWAAFDERANQKGLVQQATLGRGKIASITAQEAYDVMEQGYLNDAAFLVKGSTDDIW